MEDEHISIWHDPLLITDVPWQQQHPQQRQNPCSNSSLRKGLENPSMADPDTIDDVSWRNRSPEAVNAENFSDPVVNDSFNDLSCWQNRSPEATSGGNFSDPTVNDCLDGCSTLGFSLASPDLVICGGSPDIPSRVYGDSPQSLRGSIAIDLSLENGIEASQKTPATMKLQVSWQKSREGLSSEASFELLALPAMEEQLPKCSEPIVSGSKDSTVIFEDHCFYGEDVAGTDTRIGGGEVQLPSPEEKGDLNTEEEFGKLRIEYESQRKELSEAKRVMEMLKRENESKNKECQEALKSLKELHNELMRKSMHVGSLAFAVEGQVKEKSRWFSSLRDMTRKLKIMKMEQINLLEEALSYRKCVADINNMSCVIQSRINEQGKLHEDLKVKFIKGEKERKELYNKMLELKGNIRVFCRCRPLNSEEIAEGASMVFDFESAKDGELVVKSNVAFKKTFKFDAVFSPQESQVDVFEDTAPFATSVLDGYNVCIFAYGQTGTGKTFTMEGTDEARGVNFRTLEELFRVIDERKHQVRYDISVSVLEVYNEQIRDLLVPGLQPGVTAKRLQIRQVGEGSHHVPGLVEACVNNMNEVWEVLQTGSGARAVGSTNANEHSSRSHCIHCVMVKGENLLNGECTRSKLWLVDLAGSERVAKTEVQGERLKETQNINRSLSALGDVISALATKSPHIPYRNSKLTHLLQDSLGGDSKTLMFVQISPNENDLSESLCSLNFASRVRGIELGPAKKQIDSTELVKYKQMNEKNKQDMKSKDLQIKKMEEAIHGLDLKMKERDLKNKSLQDKVKELESQLLIERKLARQHVDTKIAEQQQIRQQEEHSSMLTRPVLATRSIVTNKNLFSDVKEQAIISRPLVERDTYKLPTALPPQMLKLNASMEKENTDPDLMEQLQMVKQRTGRASICPTAARRIVSAVSAPRRNSLIPLPSVVGPASAKFAPQLLPLTSIQQSDRREEDENETQVSGLAEPADSNSPKENNKGPKRLGSILRISLQKKIQMKSPMMQPYIRRVGGVNVGMERVRVSIGNRRRMAHRVLLTNGRKVATRDNQPRQNQREIQRRWNTGTGGRTLV